MHFFIKNSLWLCLFIVLTACGAFSSDQENAFSEKFGTSSSSTQSFQYKVVGKEFKKIEDDSVFNPHGVNYVRLADINGQKNWHANFDPETYDRKRTQNDLIKIKKSGYNLVRVFISFKGIVGSQDLRDVRDKTLFSIWASSLVEKQQEHRKLSIVAIKVLKVILQQSKCLSAETIVSL